MGENFLDKNNLTKEQRAKSKSQRSVDSSNTKININ